MTLPPRPKGLPIASTQSPTRELSLSPQSTGGQRLVGLDLQQRDIGLGVAPDEFGLKIGVVVQNDGDLVGVGDHVIVGDDVARRVDDEAGAERGRPCAAEPPDGRRCGTPCSKKSLKELLERRARRELRHFGSAMLAPAFGFHRLGRRNVDHRGQQLLGEIGEAVGRRPSGGRRRDEHRRSGDQKSSEHARSRAARQVGRQKGHQSQLLGAKANGCFRAITGSLSRAASEIGGEALRIPADSTANIIAAPARQGQLQRRRPPAPPAARFAAERQERAPRPASCLPETERREHPRSPGRERAPSTNPSLTWQAARRDRSDAPRSGRRLIVNQPPPAVPGGVGLAAVPSKFSKKRKKPLSGVSTKEVVRPFSASR